MLLGIPAIIGAWILLAPPMFMFGGTPFKSGTGTRAKTIPMSLFVENIRTTPCGSAWPGLNNTVVTYAPPKCLSRT